MDDAQILLQVLNNVVTRNSRKIYDYEVEIANYMTTVARLEAKIALLEEQNEKYLESLEKRENQK